MILSFAPGDIIDIAVNPSSKEYTENVVINTADLTLLGKGKANGSLMRTR